ncbi:MAG: methionine--tRNA ligase [Candidatus Aenigmatarchaeota archaeon]|nr:MAG: methionine--tRNA ligase [Candidatus Aenigmarchaeota archaeon]
MNDLKHANALKKRKKIQSSSKNAKKTGKKFYITTAIDYVNAKPHIGHALEKTQADALARYHRLKGDDVFFLTGTDEHGTKVLRAAKDAGVEPQEFCDSVSERFVELTKLLDISNDDFIRTTDRVKHWPGVQKLWELCKRDIVKRKYKGFYCVGCEAFVLEKDLTDGLCPIHKKKPEVVEEENYFFLLSRYANRIKEAIEKDVYRVVPQSRKNEILSLIKEGLQDVSVSRPRHVLPWGIPVPGDHDHTIYVWIDALPNYATAVGFGRDEKTFDKWWPADVHAIGKDILRFHAAIWPGLLLSAGLPLPKTLFVHGFITSGGEKMSKTLGNVVDPVEYAQKYGSDALRYHLLAELPSQDDGDFTKERFIRVYNSALANELGNLVMRVTTLTTKHLGTKHPQVLGESLKTTAERLAEDFGKHLEAYEFDKACAAVWTLVRAANKYLNESEPWKIAKDKEKFEAVLYNITESLRFLSVLCEPIIPKTAAKIREQFGFPEPSLKELEWGYVCKGQIREAPPLFPKIETAEKEEDPFAAFDLRVARVLSVSEHPDAEKLYVLQLDLGEEKRQLVAGLRAHYAKEELIGKKVVVIANLEHAKLRGVASEGMLLAGDDGNHVGALNVKNAAPGTQVSAQGIKPAPKARVTLKEFQKIKLVVGDGGVYYGERPLVAGAERVKAERVGKGAQVR